MTPHIGLNMVFLVPGETGGMEVYARELLRELQKQATDLRFTVFINRELVEQKPGWLEGVSTVLVPVEARNRFEWVRGEQFLLPRLADKAGIHLLHSLASTAPSVGKFRKVVSVLDLLYKVHPQTHSGIRGLGMRILVPLAARRADHIITISESSARDIRHFLKVPPAKISVTPLGPGSSIVTGQLSSEEIRRRFQLGDRSLILTTSAKRSHKNLLRLLDAMALFPQGNRPLLLLPGYATPHEEDLKRHCHQLLLDDDVRFVGWLGQEELEALFSLASVFVFPSLYEGFGLPVLEAMRRGVPVACSHGGSLAEVAGDAALIFDPTDARAIHHAMEKLLTDSALAGEMIRKGREQALQFTWEKTTRLTADVYRKLLR